MSRYAGLQSLECLSNAVDVVPECGGRIVRISWPIRSLAASKHEGTHQPLYSVVRVVVRPSERLDTGNARLCYCQSNILMMKLLSHMALELQGAQNSLAARALD